MKMLIAKILIILLYLSGIILIIPGLSGLWVIVGTNLAVKLILPDIFPWWYVITGIILAMLSEILDWVFGIAGAKKAKASKYSIVLSLLFSIILAVLFTSIIPVIGSLIGVFVGSFIGCFFGELVFYRKTLKHAGKAGFGSMLGRIFSVFAKLGFGLIIISFGLYQVFFAK